MTLRPKLAGSLLLTRMREGAIEVLMGRRSSAHAFMPKRYVFPGGRVDRVDHFAPLSGDLEPQCLATMCRHMDARKARAIAVSAVRETAEETGLIIGKRADVPSRHKAWAPFRSADACPNISGLSLIARAITPPGRVRRFDAWFFRADITQVIHTPSNFVMNELEDLRWVDLETARSLELPHVTHFVLGELERLDANPTAKPRHIRELAKKVRLITL